MVFMTHLRGQNCDECDQNLYGRGVVDHYHLTHSYTATSPDRKSVIGPVSETLDVYFCSAPCLCSYVERHIRPDAATE